MLDRTLWNPPMVIAHRGSRELWPENTMVAFEKAVTLGVEHLETDIRVSADGVVHCFHDHTLQRTTGAEGPFSDVTADEVSQLDAGFNHRGLDGFEFRDSGVTIPRFEELVLAFPDVRIVVDLKEDAVVEPFARLVHRLQIGHRLIVGSFSDRRLDAFGDLVRHTVHTSTGYDASRRWLLSSRRGRPVEGVASALQIPLQIRGLRLVDKKLLDVAHEAGLQVHVWTVNETARMNELLDLGVDALITDRPDLAVDVLSQH